MARTKVPALQLDTMLRARALTIDACDRCVIEQVIEISPDASGCNWRIAMIHGSRSSDCLLAMTEYICELRAKYLVDGSEATDPTLLTTWAMR